MSNDPTQDQMDAATDKVVRQYEHLESLLSPSGDWNVETVATLCAVAIVQAKELEAENAELEAENTRLKNAFDALTSDEAVQCGVDTIVYHVNCNGDAVLDGDRINQDVERTITAVRKYVLEGKS